MLYFTWGLLLWIQHLNIFPWSWFSLHQTKELELIAWKSRLMLSLSFSMTCFPILPFRRNRCFLHLCLLLNVWCPWASAKDWEISHLERISCKSASIGLIMLIASSNANFELQFSLITIGFTMLVLSIGLTRTTMYDKDCCSKNSTLLPRWTSL